MTPKTGSHTSCPFYFGAPHMPLTDLEHMCEAQTRVGLALANMQTPPLMGDGLWDTAKRVWTSVWRMMISRGSLASFFEWPAAAGSERARVGGSEPPTHPPTHPARALSCFWFRRLSVLRKRASVDSVRFRESGRFWILWGAIIDPAAAQRERPRERESEAPVYGFALPPPASLSVILRDERLRLHCQRVCAFSLSDPKCALKC